MNVTTVATPGVVVFLPQPRRDHRGLFSWTFATEIARDVGIHPGGLPAGHHVALGPVRRL